MNLRMVHVRDKFEEVNDVDKTNLELWEVFF